MTSLSMYLTQVFTKRTTKIQIAWKHTAIITEHVTMDTLLL